MAKQILASLRDRGVPRVAASYAVIAWLVLQIADVALQPFDVPNWVRRAPIIIALLGFPIAITLAWFFELGDGGINRDDAPAGTARPVVRGPRRFTDLAIIAVLGAIVVFFLAREAGWLGRTMTPAGVGPESSSLAVLPFAAVGPVPEPYLSEGLSDELRNQFSQMRALSVTARSSSVAMDQRTLDAVAIANKLSVAALLEGTVGRERGRLQVSVQLVNGGNGKVLWAERYDRPDNEILKVQAEIAGAVVAAVLPRFAAAGKAAPPPPTADPVAYDLYLLARQKLRDVKVVGDESAAASINTQIVELLRSAIAADPKFAQAHATLARALLPQALQEAASLDMAERAAAVDRVVLPEIERALKIDPNNAEAYFVKGIVLRNTDRPGGGAAYRRAVELDPNNVPALTSLAYYEGTNGNPEERYRLVMRARALDPMDVDAHVGVILGAFALGLRDEMLANSRRMLETFPDNDVAHQYSCMSWLFAGDFDESLACAAKQLNDGTTDGYLRAELNDIAGESAEYLGDEILAGRYFDQGAAGTAGASAAARALGVRHDVPGLRRAAADARHREVSPDDWNLADALAMNGQVDDAIDIYRRSGIADIDRKQSPLKIEAMHKLVRYAALLQLRGRSQEAQVLLQQPQAFAASALSHGGGRTAAMRFLHARTCLVAGRTEEGLGELERALDSVGSIFSSVDTLLHDPVFRDVQDNPRFKAVVEQLRTRMADARARTPATFKKYGLAWPPP